MFDSINAELKNEKKNPTFFESFTKNQKVNGLYFWV